MKKLCLLSAVLLSCAGIASAIPDPSAVYCVEQGYEFEVRSGPAGQYGVCIFPDGSECSTWQFYCNCEPDGIGCSPGYYYCHWPCEELPCKQAGECAFISECCPGLSEIVPAYVYDEQCNLTDIVGWLYICSDCGNGICESWEDRCNCVQDCGDIDWIISDCPVEVDELEVDAVVVVTNTGCLIVHDRSYIDGDYAHLIVDGGTVTVFDRFDMGRGDDAYLVVQDGGSFTQTGDSDGLKLPDEEGGVHRIIIRNIGTVQCDRIELIPERDAEVHVGWGVTLVLDHALESPPGRYNPEEWLKFGWLVPIDGVTEEDITITWNGDTATVTTPPPCWPKPSSPDPADGEKGVASAVSNVVLSWTPACGIGELGRHYLFFSTDKDCVNNAPTYSIGWTPPDCYVHPPLFAGVTSKNIGNQPIWSTFYWRIDEKLETGEMIKGYTWSFTTGCDPIPAGDVNLDCLVNLDDWALIMTTWGEEQFFPWD